VGLIYALSRGIVPLCNQEKKTKWLVNLADVVTWRVWYKTYKQNHAKLSLELLSDITDNFSDEREIGRGGFGVVYKVK